MLTGEHTRTTMTLRTLLNGPQAGADAMSGGWSGSNRSKRLPSNWNSLRARMLSRDNYQCRMIEHGTRCEQIASDVDHMQASGPDEPSNLVSLCRWHHGQKTAQEGNQARTRQRRDAEPHPGLLPE